MDDDYSFLHDDSIEFVETSLDKYKCKLCHKIIIDCHGTPCGCLFCEQCIRTYLSERDLRCPNKEEFCNGDFLNFDKNISRNHKKNCKIKELKMICLYNGCDLKLKVKDFPYHSKICDLRIVDCPYKVIGCDVKSLQKHLVNKHLLDQCVEHSVRMVNWMGTMRSEFDALSNEKEQLRITTEKLSETTDHLKNELETLKEMCSETNKQCDQLKDLNRSSYICTIDDFTKKFQDAQANNNLYFDTEPFILCGYNISGRIYPYFYSNSYVPSFGICLVKGAYDDEIKWPCTKKFYASLIKGDNSDLSQNTLTFTSTKPGNNNYTQYIGLCSKTDITTQTNNLILNGTIRIRIICD